MCGIVGLIVEEFDNDIYDFLEGVTLVYCPECSFLILVDADQWDGKEDVECDNCGFGFHIENDEID